MPPFPKPDFPFEYDPEIEIASLRAHKAARAIPGKDPARLLVATWNIANFGVQLRREQDRRLIAEILGWFDIVAIQEVNENFGDLVEVERLLGPPFRILMSDSAGNNERLAFLYDSAKVRLLENIGEVAVPPGELANVAIAGNPQHFPGFDRTPYFATFQSGSFTFMLVTVHLLFGSEKPADVQRRALEAFAVARWAGRMEKSRFAFTRDIVALGDFNLPKPDATDAIFNALTLRGLELPEHSSAVGSSIASDNHYDQVAFFPGETRDDFTGLKGVFDFDAVVFKELWDARGKKAFQSYVRYYLSDHRPMWVQFRTAAP